MSWILRVVNTSPPRFLRDYRRGEAGRWTLCEERAEKFHRAVDAIEMARRLSWIRGIAIEAVSTDPAVPAGETCTTLGCGRPVEPGRMHCEVHARLWGQRPVIELVDPDVMDREDAILIDILAAGKDPLLVAGELIDPDTIDPDLTPQEVEAAFHQAIDETFERAWRDFRDGDDGDPPCGG